MKYIARQYDKYVNQEKKLRRGEIDRDEGGNCAWKQPDPTGNTAIGIIVKSKADRIRAIEEAARTAGTEIYTWLLRCVTRGETWKAMRPPCGESQFYAARRRFYAELDKRIN